MAGESAGKVARSTHAVAARYRAKADRLDRVADAYRKGEIGERLVAELLCELAPLGYYHLRDRALPGSPANIDHAVVGPAGVLVVDAKNWSGSLSISGGVVARDGRRSTVVADAAAYGDAVVAAVNGPLGPVPVPVRSLVCFVGDGQLGAPKEVGRVHLVDGGDLHEFVAGLPRALTQAQVERVLVTVIDALPLRTGAAPEGLPSEEPAEPVLFLNAWRKHGKYRIYVKRSDGSDMGSLDLLAGTARAEHEDDEALLQQLLPHYLRGDMPGTSADEVNAEERGVMTRLLDSLLGRKPRRPARAVVTCYLWRKHDISRLYVHRIAPDGTKVDLGWVDPTDDRHHAIDPSANPILGSCSRRYRELERARVQR